MSEKHIEKLKNVPKLRFPEFRDAGEWEETTLDNIGKFTGGGTPSKSNEAYWNGTIPWISSSDISEESIYQVNISRFITEEALQNSATKFVPSNSILLVSRVGVGKLAITTKTICTSQDFTSFTPNKDNLIFLAYLLKSIEKSLISLNQGTSIRGFTREEIGKLMIRLPTLPEQQTIADCLASLDDRLAAETHTIETLKAHKKGLMQQLFPAEGETLPKLRFPEFRDAGEWEKKELGEISHKIMVGIASAATYAYRKSGIILFRNQNIKEGYLDDNDILFIDEDYEKWHKNKRLKAGDLLTARTGYPGTTCVVSAKYEGSQSFTTLITRPNNSIVSSNYLCIFINSEKGRAFFNSTKIGGGQQNVNAGSLTVMPILYPTHQEQQTIADCLTSLDETIALQAETIALLKVHKKGLMQQLFPAVEEAKR